MSLIADEYKDRFHFFKHRPGWRVLSFFPFLHHTEEKPAALRFFRDIKIHFIRGKFFTCSAPDDPCPFCTARIVFDSEGDKKEFRPRQRYWFYLKEARLPNLYLANFASFQFQKIADAMLDNDIEFDENIAAMNILFEERKTLGRVRYFDIRDIGFIDQDRILGQGINLYDVPDLFKVIPDSTYTEKNDFLKSIY